MEKPDCDGDCLWCESSFGPASCYSKQQADFLPTGFFKCRKHKEDEVPALIAKSGEPGPPTPGPTPGPGASCSGATDRKACRHQKGCVWCEGSFGPASCYDEVRIGSAYMHTNLAGGRAGISPLLLLLHLALILTCPCCVPA